MKILIVEDDHVLNNGIALSLANDEVLQAFSVKKAETTKRGESPFCYFHISFPFDFSYL